MLVKINRLHIFIFALGTACGALILFLTNMTMAPRHTERLPFSFVPGTKITETKLDDRTYLYLSSYTAAQTQNLPAAPLLDRMTGRAREASDRAFVMLSFNPATLCQTTTAHRAATAILMRPLSDNADEIVEVPD